ncbi:ATP-binding protein [Candidatus Uhrbacteria bacterium]|jgi:uncharacterized protein|nr:ATP-binding protein [Candidatus Uhrbacteria bacterium]
MDSERQKLIIVGGSPATGKTTLAMRLENDLGIKRVSMDEIKERLFDSGGYRDRDWSKEIGRLAWPVFKGLVELNIKRGNDVIADATFLWADDYLWLNQLKEEYDLDLIQFWMTAPPDVRRDRFVNRANNERHPGHCDSLESVMQEFESRFFSKTFIPSPINGKTKIVDTTDFSAVDHDEILGWI